MEEVRGRKGNKKIKTVGLLPVAREQNEREKSKRGSVEKGSKYNGMLNEVEVVRNKDYNK